MKKLNKNVWILRFFHFSVSEYDFLPATVAFRKNIFDLEKSVFQKK